MRKFKNITQEKLAEMINMDITSLSKIETGRNYPQPETIEKISQALNIEISQLFSFHYLSTEQDYISAINKNIKFLSQDKYKLKLLYEISSAFI